MAAALVLAVLAGAILLWQRPWVGEPDPGAGAVSLPADARSRLTAQLREMSRASSQDAFVAAAGDLPAAQAFAKRTWRAMQSVAMPGATFRYVSGGEVADRADGSAAASAEVSWQPSPGSGLDPAATYRSTVELRVRPEADGTLSVVGAAQVAGQVPIWLIGDVAVDDGAGRTVVRVDGGGSLPLEDMATTARAAVERVLPGVDGRLTIISPRTRAQMAAIVGQESDAVAQIAAITTGLDGDPAAGQPVVVLNPTVFATMDRRAAQVVLTHEATHALTTAVGTTGANWVVEGFADFVALRDDTAPLSVSAGQALADVRAGRVPEGLPADADFSSTGHGLGALYESTWMIFRLLARDHPDSDLVAFYQQVVGGEPVDRALQSTFGLTADELTARWRDYLTKSASTTS
ncbi:hypothetical protein [Aeromicrobium wangtongii]|uniref:Peptidase MA superfamily protein n=1 Tax=Aeromicrobium wangtongii TaxID=2969247 RepID=A0ABY5MA52_9ACTN|nr:hypothetical protein [Aeromicrobium wangtongii]MCD9197524.1 hypothetical protein [Aeromicrobium wangtongii]UUP15015.1 hypothetical protein NQV15_06805 [Aeromicrobium wangtongii]